MPLPSYEQITGLSAVKRLTIPDGAKRALIQATTQNVRWRDDGVDPTATVGMVLAAGSTLDYGLNQRASMDELRFIEVTASAVINVTYY